MGEMRALLGLCDRYYLLTEILGRANMLWHGDPGESVPAGNVWLYEWRLSPMAGSTCGLAITTRARSSPTAG